MYIQMVSTNVAIYIYIGVEVFWLSNSLQNCTCTFSNMLMISAACARRWSWVVEWSGVLETTNWSRVVIEHMHRGVFQSPVGTIVPTLPEVAQSHVVTACGRGVMEWSYGVKVWSRRVEWNFGVIPRPSFNHILEYNKW
jgi:hypothetical protein